MGTSLQMPVEVRIRGRRQIACCLCSMSSAAESGLLDSALHQMHTVVMGQPLDTGQL